MKNKKPKLKSCPFCGSKDISIHTWDITDSYFVMCNNCTCRMDDFIEDKNGISKPVTLKEAVRDWNRRS